MFVYVCFISGPCNQTWNWCLDIKMVKIREVLNKDSPTASPGHETPIFHQPNLPCAWPCAKPDKICRSSSAISAPVLMKNACKSVLMTSWPSRFEKLQIGISRLIHVFGRLQKHDSNLIGNKYQGDWTGTFSDWQWCHDIRWCPWS